MFEKMIELVLRITVVLERMADLLENKQVDTAAPAPVQTPQVQGFDPAVAGQERTETINVAQTPAGQVVTHLTDPAAAVNPAVNPAAAVQGVNPSAAVGQAQGVVPSADWDPTCAAKQGSYRTKDKQAAIVACLNRLNIQAPKSWSWAKKHQAILDRVSQFGAVMVMSWADFAINIKNLVANNQKDDILAVVLELEGHQVVGESNIQPSNYQVILDMVAARTAPPIAGAVGTGAAVDPNIVTRQVDPATLAVIENPVTPAEQAADYTPGASVTTLDQLRAYCRYLTENGLAPAAVQSALAPIAAGVTYVTVDQIPQAVQLLNSAASPASLV